MHTVTVRDAVYLDPMLLRDATDGTDLDQVLLVREVERRPRRDGGEFLRLTLGDRSGRVPAMVWDGVREASELAAEHPWVAQVQRAITSVRGVAAPVVGMTFATDARFVRNDAGIPAVVCGPGGIEQAHIDDEWVGIDELVDAAAVYAELFASFDNDAAAALPRRPTTGAGR